MHDPPDVAVLVQVDCGINLNIGTPYMDSSLSPSQYLTITLRFVRMNSPVIIFERVSYFCENSRSTLLSVSAFKKFNTYFHVNTNFDTISLLSPSGKLVLCSSSYQKTDTWPVKQPLQTPHAPPVKGLNSFTYPAAEHIQMKSCPVCSIFKATSSSLLGPSHQSSEKLSIFVCDLMVKVLKAKADTANVLIKTLTSL
ncbi:uncharacterized protein VP01_640g4 [Puccinia sorghi]|uniref:Uncharacterized protein n=1 Tax=Puccinia sorghi TaxID=27349 RepID=A0A0L6UHZ4_9BASI|nr:uncharacterized protein VP01_640g4 [Puccinia sorghi]